MDSATVSAVKPTFFIKGPEHMNSKRSYTEETRVGDVGNAEYNLLGPCPLHAMVMKYLWVVERKTTTQKEENVLVQYSK